MVEMHVTNWAKAQRDDPVLSEVLDWLKAQKQTNLGMLLAEHASSEEGELILWSQQNFMIHWGLYFYAQHPKAKLKISYSLWSPRHTMLPH